MAKERDALDVIQLVMNNLSLTLDAYFALFIQYRNIKTGANTITKSGLTSPNGQTSGIFGLAPSGNIGAILMEWPAISANGQNICQGKATGQTSQITDPSTIAWLEGRGYIPSGQPGAH